MISRQAFVTQGRVSTFPSFKLKLMKKSLGQATNVRIFLDKPMKMNFLNLELNKLNIMVGMNGTGKSFLLATVYALSYIVNAKILARVHNAPFDEMKIAEFVIGSCFNSDITGTIALNYESSVSVDIAVKDGQVLNVNINNSESVDIPTVVKYMSSAFRTFSAMCSYLVSRRNSGKTDPGEVVMEMTKHYKLYDVMYIEKLINRMPMTVDDALKKHLIGFDVKEEIESFDVDLGGCIFTAKLKDGSSLAIHRWFGSGHQSLINMMLGQII